MMTLAVDIGNTNICFCLFMNKKIFHVKYLKSSKKLKQKELNQILLYFQNKHYNFSNVIICSVVPEIETLFLSFFKKKNYKIIFVNEILSNLNIKTEILRKREIGADRLVNVNYCLKKFKVPFLIIDLGTATTFDFVNEKRVYEGGLILPGIETSLKSLEKNTSKLPYVSFKKTKKLISNTTEGAISSGFYWGYVLMINALIKEIRKEKKRKFKVILTGGFSEHFQNLSSEYIIDKYLTMKGLFLLNA